MPTGTKRSIESTQPTEPAPRRARTRSVKARLTAENEAGSAAGGNGRDYVAPAPSSKAQVRGKQRRPTPKAKKVKTTSDARTLDESNAYRMNDDDIQPRDVVADTAEPNDFNSSDHSTISLRVSAVEEAKRVRLRDSREEVRPSKKERAARRNQERTASVRDGDANSDDEEQPGNRRDISSTRANDADDCGEASPTGLPENGNEDGPNRKPAERRYDSTTRESPSPPNSPIRPETPPQVRPQTSNGNEEDVRKVGSVSSADKDGAEVL